MISLRGVQKRHGDTLVLNGVSSEVRPGTVTGVISRNGGGKSTLLRLIAGVERPTAGSISVFGRDYRGDQVPARTLGAVLDPPGWQEDSSASRHLRTITATNALPALRIAEVLEGVGLTKHANKLVHQPLHLWPRHQRQRLAIAAALLADPDVIVMDDPFQGLDDTGTDWVKYLLRSLATAGKTVLVALDRVQDLENTADQVLVLHRGRLVLDASVRDLRAPGANGRVTVRSEYVRILGEVLRARGASVLESGHAEPCTLQVTGMQLTEVADVARRNSIPVQELREDRDPLGAAIAARLRAAGGRAVSGTATAVRGDSSTERRREHVSAPT